MLTINRVFVTRLTLQEMLLNRSRSDINRENSLYVFYIEIIIGHVNSLGAAWRHFYMY